MTNFKNLPRKHFKTFKSNYSKHIRDTDVVGTYIFQFCTKLLNLLSANDIGSIAMNDTTISDEEETISGIPITQKGTNSIWISIFLQFRKT